MSAATVTCSPIDPPTSVRARAPARLAGLRHALAVSSGWSPAAAYDHSPEAVATAAAPPRAVDAGAVSAGRLNLWLLNRRD